MARRNFRKSIRRKNRSRSRKSIRRKRRTIRRGGNPNHFLSVVFTQSQSNPNSFPIPIDSAMYDRWSQADEQEIKEFIRDEFIRNAEFRNFVLNIRPSQGFLPNPLTPQSVMQYLFTIAFRTRGHSKLDNTYTLVLDRAAVNYFHDVYGNENDDDDDGPPF